MITGVHSGNMGRMDVRIDPLAEPMRCAHGSEFVVSQDGQAVWLTPCAACEAKTVAGTSRCLARAAA